MFALVKFNNKSYSIYHMKNVKVQDEQTCIVKHSGCKYEAQLLASNESRKYLQSLKDDFERRPENLSPNESMDESYKSNSTGTIIERTPETTEEHLDTVGGERNQKPRIISIKKFPLVSLDRYSIVKLQADKISLAKENSSRNKSIDDSNNTNMTDTSIEESAETTDTVNNTDGTYTLTNSGALLSGTVSSETHMVELNNCQGAITHNVTSEDSVASPLEQSRTTNIDSSNYLVDPLVLDANALFPSGKLLTSSPLNFRFDEPTNLPTDNNSANNNSKSTSGEHPYNTDSGECESNNIERDDPDYAPQHETMSDSASDSESAIDQACNLGSNNDSSNNSHNISNGLLNISIAKNISGSNRCNDEDLYVEKSRGRNGDNKYNFCVYCHTKQKKIARHLELKHKNEEDVKKFTDLPKNNSERKKIIGEIRKQGNFLFNTQTKYNDGELIVSRRPNTKFTRSSTDFRACANCKAFFSKNSLRMHFAKCTGRRSKKSRIVMVMSRQVTARVHSRASDTVLNVIFPPLREDHVVRAVRYDELVIVYANKMGEKYQNAREYEMIRQRIRLLGRFLVTMRKLNKDVTDLASVFDPKFCDDAITAIVIEAKLLPSSEKPVTPAVASSLGTLLKLLGSILITESIKKHDDAIKKNTKDFLKLLTQELALNINRRVTEFQAQQHRRKKVELPSMEDVKILCRYLEEKRDAAFQELNENFSEAGWMTLAETTLTSLQLFNRRRAGEIERTLIEDFQNYQSLDENTDKDLFNTLSTESQSLAKRYVRFVIRGKLNRTVPVLLSTELVKCIKLLLRHRKNMKVSESNPYIFGLKGEVKSKHNHLRACALLRKFSSECGAKHPERLRGTKLRKHIATVCVSLNLKEHQITDLANYMGHAEKIHKDIYRQPIVNREILGISKLLEVAQGVNEEEDDEDDNDSDGEDEPPEYDDQDTSNHLNKKNRHLGNVSYENDEIFTTPNQKNRESAVKKRRFTSPYGSVKRTPWNDAEKQKVLELFGERLRNKKLPSLKEIHSAINENPCLQNRTSPQVKTWLHNQIRAKPKRRKLCEA